MISILRFLTFFFLLLVTTHGVDRWTPFYEVGSTTKTLSQGTTQIWQDDCQPKDGLKAIKMECGKVIGSVQLQCKDKSWLSRRGNGNGNGNGPIKTISADNIVKVVIRADAANANSISFYDGLTFSHTCGASKAGKIYVATAPSGMKLCALKGRAGSLVKTIQAGWCAAKPTIRTVMMKRYTNKECYACPEYKMPKSFTSPKECGMACKKKFPNSKWFEFGKKGNAGSRWSRVGVCLCEITQTCSLRVTHWGYDTYEIVTEKIGEKRSPGCWVYAPQGCRKRGSCRMQWGHYVCSWTEIPNTRGWIPTSKLPKVGFTGNKIGATTKSLCNNRIFVRSMCNKDIGQIKWVPKTTVTVNTVNAESDFNNMEVTNTNGYDMSYDMSHMTALSLFGMSTILFGGMIGIYRYHHQRQQQNVDDMILIE